MKPVKLDNESIIRMYESGYSLRQLSSLFDCSKATIYRTLKKLNIHIKPLGRYDKPTYVYIHGKYYEFGSRKEFAKALGKSREYARRCILQGKIQEVKKRTYRAHPGLDAMPTPYPFETFSREIYNARMERSGIIRSPYITIPYPKRYGRETNI